MTHPTMPTPRWWGCEYPERPYDLQVNYDNACRSCWLAAKAASLQGFGGHVRTSRGITRTLSQWVEQYAPFHDRLSA